MITSVENRQVKEVVALRRSRERRRRGLFLAEGPREVARARAAGLRIVQVYYAPALLDWGEGEPVSERVLGRMAYRAEPEGVVAAAERAIAPRLPGFSMPTATRKRVPARGSPRRGASTTAITPSGTAR